MTVRLVADLSTPKIYLAYFIWILLVWKSHTLIQ
jgi:hypothetical protein